MSLLVLMTISVCVVSTSGALVSAWASLCCAALIIIVWRSCPWSQTHQQQNWEDDAGDRGDDGHAVLSRSAPSLTPQPPQAFVWMLGAESWGGRRVIAVKTISYDMPLSVLQKSHLTLGDEPQTKPPVQT